VRCNTSTLKLINSAPPKVFVNPSAFISFVVLYSVSTCLSFIASITKCNHVLICLVLVAPPPSMTILITDELSWYIFGFKGSESVTKPKNSANSSTNPRVSDKASNSASVGLLLMHFCFLDPKYTDTPSTLHRHSTDLYYNPTVGLFIRVHREACIHKGLHLEYPQRLQLHDLILAAIQVTQQPAQLLLIFLCRTLDSGAQETHYRNNIRPCPVSINIAA
jgi:hypothetical protein